MKITNTLDPQQKPSIVMLVYGNGGVGKTTFSSTAPKPILADCENGAKYLGLRGISMDVAHIEKWKDAGELLEVLKDEKYDTVIIDPLDELMAKIKRAMIAQGDAKLVQKDGSPSMAGWGWVKDNFRNYIKAIRDSRKHVILVAHVDEAKDEMRLIKRPKVGNDKMVSDFVDMVDIVGFMENIETENGSKRLIRVEESSDRFLAKDRTGQLGKIIEPDFKKIIEVCQGTKTYKWSRSEEMKREVKPSVKSPVTPTTVTANLQDKLAVAAAK